MAICRGRREKEEEANVSNSGCKRDRVLELPNGQVHI
jgi:hypothetical protein